MEINKNKGGEKKPNLKKVFLEYLRNLTPQVLIFTVAMIFAFKLDLSKIDISNVKASLPFLLTMTVFFLAVIVNMLTFVEDSLGSFEDIDSKMEGMRSQGVKRWRMLWSITKYILANKKRGIAASLILFIIVNVSFLVVIFSSFVSIAKFYELMH